MSDRKLKWLLGLIAAALWGLLLHSTFGPLPVQAQGNPGPPPFPAPGGQTGTLPDPNAPGAGIGQGAPLPPGFGPNGSIGANTGRGRFGGPGFGRFPVTPPAIALDANTIYVVQGDKLYAYDKVNAYDKTQLVLRASRTIDDTRTGREVATAGQ